jgi:RES domain-containing protein
MFNSWRIVKAKYAATAFDGEGARIAGGRWNSRGRGIVYTGQSAALAALELLIHLGRSRSLPDYVIFSCTFAESLVETIVVDDLPDDWRSYPAPAKLQRLGDAWFKQQRSAVLQVPSAVIETESNFLLNPRHPDFRRIKISKSHPFELDLRLLRH